jgi:hypothetical protein
VRQVGHLPELYEDAQLEKYKSPWFGDSNYILW